MLLEKSKIHKILIVSLTNIGDVILTFPIVDILRQDFSEAQISIVVGPKASSLFNQNPHLHKIYIYDKKQPILKTVPWIFELRREKFDLMIDLRNSAIPFFTSPRYRTTYKDFKDKDIHKKDKHLNRLKSIYFYPSLSSQRYAVSVCDQDKAYIDKFIYEEIGQGNPFVLVGAGAADPSKRWTEEGFAEVCDQISKRSNVKIVFIGDEDDRKVAQSINKLMNKEAINLCGRTTLIQLAQLLLQCQCILVNDSAPMHLASYLNVPVLAVFSPTDPNLYGPWGKHARMIQKASMQDITSQDVLDLLEIKEGQIRLK